MEPRTKKEYIVIIEADVEKPEDMEVFANLFFKHPYVASFKPVNPPTDVSDDIFNENPKHTINNPIIFMESDSRPGDYRGQDELYDTIFDASGTYVSIEYAKQLVHNNKKAAELITNLSLDNKELRDLMKQ